MGKGYSGVRKRLSFAVGIGVIEISTVKNIGVGVSKVVRSFSYLISLI